MNKTFKKHCISFSWRLGGMITVAILNEVSKHLISLNLEPSIMVIVGLAVGEITKFINVNILQENK